MKKTVVKRRIPIIKQWVEQKSDYVLRLLEVREDSHWRDASGLLENISKQANRVLAQTTMDDLARDLVVSTADYLKVTQTSKSRCTKLILKFNSGVKRSDGIDVNLRYETEFISKGKRRLSQFDIVSHLLPGCKSSMTSTSRTILLKGTGGKGYPVSLDQVNGNVSTKLLPGTPLYEELDAALVMSQLDQQKPVLLSCYWQRKICF